MAPNTTATAVDTVALVSTPADATRVTDDATVTNAAADVLSQEGQTLLRNEPIRIAPKSEPDVLEIPNIFQSTKLGAADRSGDRPVQPRISIEERDTPVTPRRWTIAVQMTETVSHDNEAGERVQAGAEPKMRSIQELAELTRNSPVTIYAQSVEPRPETVNEDGSITSSGPHYVATYRIENGEATLVERGVTEGFQSDLQSLLTRASARAGDGNLGLIIQSHGFASEGVGGATGEATLPQLEQTIRDGLLASGRTALDLLNFDSCSMGNIDVAQAMQGEARHVVASSELERVYGNTADGQNLQHTLRTLMANPEMTAEQLAQASIEQARAGVNGDPTAADNGSKNGTETLAHYNLNQFPQVENSMGSLGAALAPLLGDPSQRAALMQVMNEVPRYESDMRNFGARFSPERADLGLFLNALDTALQSGRINDTDNNIRNAINATRASLEQFVPGYAGQPYNHYDRMSGVSIFLPGEQAFNIDERAADSTRVGQLLGMLASPKSLSLNNREYTVDEIRSTLAELGTSVNDPRFASDFKRFSESNSQDEVNAAAASLLASLRSFQESPQAQAAVARQRALLIAARDAMYDRQLTRSPQQWQAFMNGLRS